MTYRALVAVTLLVGAFLFGLKAAGAHDFYPWDCCSDRDCAPHPADDIEETVEGFTIKSTGEFVERAKVRVAPDGQFHSCRNPNTNVLICLFQPFRGT